MQARSRVIRVQPSPSDSGSSRADSAASLSAVVLTDRREAQARNRKSYESSLRPTPTYPPQATAKASALLSANLPDQKNYNTFNGTMSSADHNPPAPPYDLDAGNAHYPQNDPNMEQGPAKSISPASPPPAEDVDLGDAQKTSKRRSVGRKNASVSHREEHRTVQPSPHDLSHHTPHHYAKNKYV